MSATSSDSLTWSVTPNQILNVMKRDYPKQMPMIQECSNEIQNRIDFDKPLPESEIKEFIREFGRRNKISSLNVTIFSAILMNKLKKEHPVKKVTKPGVSKLKKESSGKKITKSETTTKTGFIHKAFKNRKIFW